MAEDKKEQPIIIVRKIIRHSAHHGGTWKVALADFMTAMFALFLVMWLVGQSDEVKQGVQGYFQDPVNYARNYRMNISSKGAGILKGGSTGEVPQNSQTLEEQLRKEMEELAAKLRSAIDDMPGLNILKKFLQLEITREGLRIQLIEGSQNVTFFKKGSATLSLKGELILKTIAMELSNLSNRLVIEGHTDGADLALPENYSNWELSADRANAARRAMMESYLKEGQVYQIRGYADNKLRIRENPLDPRNRRITILVMNRLIGRQYTEDTYESPIMMSEGL